MKIVLSNNIDPFLVAFLRFFIAVLTTLPFYIASSKKGVKPERKDVIIISGIGVVGVAFFSLLLSFGLNLTSATSSSILINSQPIYAALLSAIFLKERFELKHLVSIILGTIGIVFVVTRGNFSSMKMGDTYFKGNLMCVAAAFFVSIYYVVLKRYIQRFGTIVPTFISTISGTIVLFFAAEVGGSNFSDITAMGMENWLLMLFIGVIATGLANIIFNRSLYAIGVIRATGFKFLVPVFGVILSILFLGEKANSWVYLGIVIVLFAIFFCNRGYATQ
jgi:drug/metabolite transporter (DMT)-like permease